MNRRLFALSTTAALASLALAACKDKPAETAAAAAPAQPAAAALPPYEAAAKGNGFTIGQMIKDFTLIADAGRSNEVPLFATGLILELYRAAANTGLREQDFFALVKWHASLSKMQDRHGPAD